MSISVSGTMTNDSLTIRLEDRVDSTNAPIAEKEIFDICEKNPTEKVVLDLENLEYISSAGLRVILKLNDHRLKAGGLFRAEAQTLRLKVALGAKAPSFPD